jgi:hypothetical protein
LSTDTEYRAGVIDGAARCCRTGGNQESDPLHAFILSNPALAADLAAERGKARIILVLQDEGVGEEFRHVWIADIPGPVEPLEGCVCVLTRRVDHCNLVGSSVAVLRDQGSESRVRGSPVAADLSRQRQRPLARRSGRFLLRGGECSLCITPQDLDRGKHRIIALSSWLKLNGPANCPLGIVEAAQREQACRKVPLIVRPQRVSNERLTNELDRLFLLTKGPRNNNIS